MDRRDYLKLFGLAGGVGGLGWYLSGNATDSPPAGTNNTTTTTPEGTQTTPTTTTTVQPPTNTEPLLAGYARFTEYDRNNVTIEVPNGSIDASKYPDGAEVTILLGNYGEPDTLTKVGRSETFYPESSGDQTLDISVETGDFEDGNPLFYVAIISKAVDKYKWGTYLAQTDRFTFSVGLAEPDPIEGVPGPLNVDSPTATYQRAVGEGRFALRLSGVTDGSPWQVEFPVEKSQYATSADRASAGRPDVPNDIISYLFTEENGGSFVPAIESTLAGLGALHVDERLKFFADVVRALPTMPEVNSGYEGPRKYIRQTLVEGGGDIEDITLVLAGLCVWDGQQTALFRVGRHMGVGVAGDFEGYSRSTDGTAYYYLEPTPAGGGVGDAPEGVKNKPTQIEQLQSL